MAARILTAYDIVGCAAVRGEARTHSHRRLGQRDHPQWAWIDEYACLVG